MTRGRNLILLAVLMLIGIGVALLRESPRSALVEEISTTGADSARAGAFGSPVPPGSPGTPAASFRAAPSEPVIHLSPEDQKKVSALEQILLSRNDNDPRIDTELKNLSPQVKAALVSKYRSWSPEKFNERGTVVFLIGREIRNPGDVDFLKSVLQEKPCLNISDCSKHPEAHTGDDDHREMINETTIRYPQLMALSALREKYLSLKEKPEGQEELLRSVRSALEEATRSPDPRIVEEAQSILKTLEN